jgi:Secretion system C-terminal sorting domain
MKKILFIFCIIVIGLFGIYLYSKKSIHSFPDLGSEEYEETRTTEINSSTLNLSEFLINQEFVGMQNDAGRVNSLAIDWSDSTHFLAGTDAGGIWKSFNRGKTWQPINDFANTLNISCVAQNKFKKNNFYYSTGINYVDNGVTLNDIYKSIDGGNTFSNVIFNNNPINFGRIDKIVCSSLDSNTIYFSNIFGITINGFSQIGGLYRTNDDFKTITKVFTGQVEDFNVSSTGTVLMSVGKDIYYSSTGNTGTFTIKAGLNTNNFIKIATCSSQPNIGYCVGTSTNSSLLNTYKTIDGGLTWIFLKALSNLAGGISSIKVKPDDPNFIVIGAPNEYYSTDGGANWTSASIGYDVRDLVFDPTNPNILFIQNDWGIHSILVNPFTVTSFDENFAKSYDSTLHNQCIYHGDYRYKDNANMVGLQDQGSHFTNNDRSTTKLMRGDGVMSFYHKQDTTVGYATPQGGQIVKIKNIHTSNWTKEVIADRLLTFNSESLGFFTSFSMNAKDGNQLFVPTQKRLWRTPNAKDWFPISRDHIEFFGYNYTAITNQLNPILYWGLNDSIFAMRNASTSSFTEIGKKAPDAAQIEKLFVDPTNDSALFFIKRDLPSKISYTSNFFSTNVVWKNLNFPTNITPKTIACWPTNNRILFVGALEGGVYITADGGSTWTKESRFPNVRVNDIKIRADDGKVFIFTYGRGAWSADFALPTSTENVVSQIDINIYPNPTYNSINISSTQNLKDVDVFITDILGRNTKKIRTNIDGIESIDISEMNTGLYIVAILDGNKKLVEKKILKL